ncbi:hypothetical protein, partial [Bifidobacterium sp.]|uniref:hypothetical protein n=1 Tax=Bifidobacterium sp. TaxID=41200 RepID=UPI0039E83450
DSDYGIQTIEFRPWNPSSRFGAIFFEMAISCVPSCGNLETISGNSVELRHFNAAGPLFAAAGKEGSVSGLF